jgi:phytoene synthase
MSEAAILDSLPVEQRLALAYAPKVTRQKMLAVMALDARLAQLVTAAREPILTQLRLAWWRDRLGEQDSAVKGEPLLALIAAAAIGRAALRDLVDAWEALLGEPDAIAVAHLADARAAAFAATSPGKEATSAVLIAGREWALHDIARRRGEWGDVAARLAGQAAWDRCRLPRPMRSLAILHALARRAQRRPDRQADPGSILVAVRVGLLGV